MPAISQDNVTGRVLRFTSHHTSFPDTAREQGHDYDSIHYSANEHYHDSSVLLIVPKRLDRKHKLNLVFWFHGWHNNIDTALQFYEIESQFLESGTNAVLVLAETAKNAPDSYGGKLEQQGMFKQLVADVMNKLKQEDVVDRKSAPGKIILAGHSGAYRVIACILANGEMAVDEVYLFDALYSQVDKFLSWIQQDKEHRFINWYTNHGGGTDEVSLSMMQQLNELHSPFSLVEESSVSPTAIKANRILFVHSAREHNVIINNPDNLKLILQNSVHLGQNVTTH
jgi:hypothetical protein